MSNRTFQTDTSNVGQPSVGHSSPLCLHGQQLTIDEVYSVAVANRSVSITDDPKVLEEMKASQDLVRKAVDSGQRIYGLTTGFGSMADLPVCASDAEASQTNLLEFLAAGTGKPIAEIHVRSAMVLRANMLLRGASGVRMEIVERLVRFLNAGATPVVGELGSIGASGDLIPLGTIARAITGQAASCKVMMNGREYDRDEVLDFLGYKPISLLPKEALAIVNGTSFSAAIALNHLHSVRNYLSISIAAHGLMIRALLGHEDPFAEFVHRCKPHPGQAWSAQIMRRLLALTDGQATELERAHPREHLQDRYSLRCFPQYIGPIVEGILRIEKTLETEMNAITDNPLIDTEAGEFFQSGNFLGQYVGMAMDELRRHIGLLAKHLDVQIALLVSPEFNHGLPPSLMGHGDSPVNMNLKGLQITGNSIMPMLTHLGNSLVDHFPTHAEQYNQNVNGLSWGSANLASQSVDLFANYAAVALIFAVQAVDLRAGKARSKCDGVTLLGSELRALYEAVYEIAGKKPGGEEPFISDGSDRSLEQILADLAESIRSEGAIVEAVSEIVDSLIKVELVT